jgi:peptidoglycan hydrolase-like protein with peptidoglycan-binding domain
MADFSSLLGSVGANGQNFQNDVKTVQTELKKLRFYSGAIHGYCDMLTTHAIRKYQSNFMFAPDGVISLGSETLKYLFDPFLKFSYGAYDPCALTLVPVESKAKVTATALEEKLKECLGKHIKGICPIEYVGTNNCAHFVAHVLSIRVGILCDLKNVTNSKSNSSSASIRVDDIYNYALSERGIWNNSVNKDGVLVFVTRKSNFNEDGRMNNQPAKHIGILFGGLVYNYSNTVAKVITDSSPDAFLKKFRGIASYGATTELYFGILSKE